jgi:hypothetical protein
MEKQALPHNISEYIREHFRGSFLSEVKERKDARGHLHYDVEVSHEGMIYTLEFDEQGDLVSKDIEEAFPDEESLIDASSPD